MERDGGAHPRTLGTEPGQCAVHPYQRRVAEGREGEERLVVLDDLAVGRVHGHRPGPLGGDDRVHRLHRLDDGQCLARRHHVTHLHEGVGPGCGER